jgi:beta-galactosidase
MRKRTLSNLNTLLIIAFCLINFHTAIAKQGKIKINLNQDWFFTKDKVDPTLVSSTINWEEINLPHTWNNLDVTDDIKGYYRGVCWYKRVLKINPSYQGENIYIHFEGVNQIAELFINGKSIGSHVGGYSRFNFRIDEFLNFEQGAENIIIIKVDNKHNDDIPPLSGDFTFFGGIYRDVNLIIQNPTHFSLNHGSTGVFVTTPTVSVKQASVKIKCILENNSSSEKKLKLISTVKSPNGQIVAEKSTVITIEKIKSREFIHDFETISKPDLWSPENPNLYTVITKIVDKTGNILDQVNTQIGFRWYKFDAKEGFFLNGKSYKLIGASRHQDFKDLGNALKDKYHINDVISLKNMGANFLRVAHYPQDPTVLETCDRLGIITSVETPIVNAITETEGFTRNCLNMQLEMIKQNFNHPSVVIWAYMNEVFLRPKFNGNKERQKEYFNSIKKLAQQIEILTRKEDPTRYTMIPNYGNYGIHKEYGILDIPMIVGWNLYQGWYTGMNEDFGKFLDKCHHDFPDKPIMVTEYGADADPRIRSLTPKKFDKSVDFSLDFHQYYLNEMIKRPFVSAALIWNLADFSSEQREETMPHINSKGMLTIDRKPKDLYYYYQSQLFETPFLQITNWRNRAGMAIKTNQDHLQTLDVFSNAPEVELFVNEISLGKKQQTKGERFTWKIELSEGKNIIIAKAWFNGKELQDKAEISYKLIDFNDNLASFNELNVLLGAKRIYEDFKTGQVWIPSQAYKLGSWGHKGGNPFTLRDTSRQSYGTDRDIRKTYDDPIYQTQQVGIEEFKADVSDGEYEVSLHFAELLSGEVKEALAYNLNDTNRKDNVTNRVFDVSINNIGYWKDLNIRSDYGVLIPIIKKLTILVEKSEGITVKFSSKQGSSILNAIQIRKTK